MNDIRKIPLSECRSLGELMFHIERCKELDKEDKKKEFITEEEMDIK